MRGLLFIVFSFFLLGCSSTSETDLETEIEQEIKSLPLLKGEFISAAHPTEGSVELNSQRTSLAITGLKADEGPLMELYLATDLQATDFISLGEMQGFEGNFTYEIPNSESIDFSKHKYLMVWCVDFSINFGHAILKE